MDFYLRQMGSRRRTISKIPPWIVIYAQAMFFIFCKKVGLIPRFTSQAMYLGF